MSHVVSSTLDDMPSAASCLLCCCSLFGLAWCYCLFRCLAWCPVGSCVCVCVHGVVCCAVACILGVYVWCVCGVSRIKLVLYVFVEVLCFHYLSHFDSSMLAFSIGVS
jgi:hypothetical protein